MEELIATEESYIRSMECVVEVSPCQYRDVAGSGSAPAYLYGITHIGTVTPPPPSWRIILMSGGKEHWGERERSILSNGFAGKCTCRVCKGNPGHDKC